jgi:aldose 1-epimerase
LALDAALLGEPFGSVNGRTALLYTLETEYLRARVTNYAGALVSLEAPDREERRDHVVLGFDGLDDYLGNRGSFGALLGRNANRIAGGRIVIDGIPFELSRNEGDDTLHGGAVGFGKRFWSVRAASTRHVTFTLTSADGDQGFPGEVSVEAAWRLDGLELSLRLTAQTTKPTPISLSAHPYFNLDGASSSDCLDHEAEIYANCYLPTDRQQIPTGEIRPVAGTPFDFRRWRRIGAGIRKPLDQLRWGRGYDHYFILPRERDTALRLAARVRSARTGRVLEVLTTQPGLQFYTGNNLDGSAPGRGGLYRQSAGFAFEPQGFPNAPNQPGFPSTILRPGSLYREEIVYRLVTDRAGASP